MTDLYKVERIIGKRIRDSKLTEYKVKWQGYPSSQSTWEPIKHLKTVMNLVEEFEARNKDKMPTVSSGSTGHPHKPSKFGATLQKKLQSQKVVPRISHLKVDEMRSEKSASKQAKHHPRPKIMTRARQNMVKVRASSQEQSPVQIGREGSNEGCQTNSVEKDDSVLGSNLEEIAYKIMCAVEEKKRQPKIVGVVRRGEEEEWRYETEDAAGQREYRSKEHVLTYLSRELIAFYERRLAVDPGQASN